MRTTTVIDNIMLFVEVSFTVFGVVKMILEPSIFYAILILAFGAGLYMNLSRRGFHFRKKDES